jgi:hypothetical protein
MKSMRRTGWDLDVYIILITQDKIIFDLIQDLVYNKILALEVKENIF